MRTRPTIAGLVLLLILPVLHLGAPSAMPASADPVAMDGCASGSMTVERGVVGYEFMSGETQSQFEQAFAGAGPTFDSQLRYTRVTFLAGALDADCTWTVPAGVTRGHLLVVGGGGAGGTLLGGGGGGGGVFYGKVPVTNTLGEVFSPGAVLSVKVGTGGAPAPASCTGVACAGGQGGASSVTVGGDVIVSAGGGGGGGGAGQSAPAMTGGPQSSGGGGGGGALTDDGTALTAGAAGAVGSIANDPYSSGTVGGLLGGTGGTGRGGAASGSTRYSGGGAGPKGVLPDQNNAGVGAVGVAITFYRAAASSPRFGAGGGGLARGLGNGGEFDHYSQPSGSPSSGGAGGISQVSPAGAGVDGTGGGGGGGGTAGAVSSLGGRGGNGVVMIAFPDPIDVTGPTTLDAVRGAITTSTAYSFTFGNPTLTTAWSVRRAGGGTLTGVSVDGSRRLVASASTPVGEHQLEVVATNTLGTVGVRAVTLTVTRAAQAAVSFATTAPTAARVGVGSYTPQLSGGSGAGAYLLSLDVGLAGVCVLNEGIVSFAGEGSCTIWGSRAGDADFEASASVTQTFVIAARAAQAPVEFSSTAPTDAVVGDGGYVPTFVGGDGAGDYVLSSGSPEVCGVAESGGAWVVQHLATGTCSLSVVRDGDGDHLASDPAVQSYVVVAAEIVVEVEDAESLDVSASVDGTRVTLAWTTPADAALIDVGVCEAGEGGRCGAVARWLTDDLQRNFPSLTTGALSGILLSSAPSTFDATAGVSPIALFAADGPEGSILNCGQLTFIITVLRPTDAVDEQILGNLGQINGAIEVLLPCEGVVVAERTVNTPTRLIVCSPAVPVAGGTVTCRLSGGDAGSEVEWRASYNPTFAGTTFSLDASGEGTFSFMVPAGALGSPLVVEVVGWGEPMVIAERVSAPVPTGVPAGGGPSMSAWPPFGIAVLLLALATVFGLRAAGPRSVRPRRG